MTSTEYKSEHLKVALKKLPGCKVQMEIEISPEAAKASYQQAIKNINKEISVPGFRKGKAPEKMVLERFPKQIDAEWKELLVRTSSQEAINLTKEYPREHIDKATIQKASMDEGAKIDIEYETGVKIPEVNFETLQIEGIELPAITDKEIEEQLEDLREQFAEFVPVTDRDIVEENDTVKITIRPSALDESQAREYQLKVAEKQMPNWMLKEAIGTKLNEEKEALQKPEGVEAEQDEYPSTSFTYSFKEILAKKLSEVDEEFAKKLGADSVEDLRTKIGLRLQNAQKTQKYAILREQVRNHLAEAYPFDIPASLVIKYGSQRMSEKLKDLDTTGLSDEERKQKELEVKDQVNKEIENEIRVHLLTHQVAEKEKFQVDTNEIVSYLLMNRGMDYLGSEQFQNLLKDEKFLIELQSHLKMQKALDFLADKALENKQ